MASMQRHCNTLLYRMQRLKTTSVTEDACARDEPRFHTTFDLSLIGLGVGFPLAVFVLSGHATADFAGPSAVLAAIFAATASGLSGLSYSELRARVSRLQAPAYDYTYRLVGEFAAFVVGWMFLLHHVTCCAAVSRAFSQNLDYVVDNGISNYTVDHLGGIAPLHSYLDFVGAVICLLTMVTSVIDLPSEGIISRVTVSGISALVLIFVLVVGLYHFNFHKWDDVESFFPNGITGVMGAAAIMTYAFWGSERILRSCDLNCRSVRKPAMTSLLLVHIWNLAVLILLSAAVSLLGGPWQTNTPLPEAYTDAHISWMRYVICPVAMLVLLPFLLDNFKLSVKSVVSLADDGLLPGFLAKRTSSTDTAVFSVIAVGVTASLATLVFPLSDLVQFLAVPILVMQMVACVITILFHYKPDLNLHSPARRKRKRLKRRGETPLQQVTSDGAGYGATTDGLSDVDADDYDRIDSRPAASNNNNIVGEEASSSDTDIDDIVEEYTTEQRVRELTENSSSSEYRRRPDVTTYRRVCVALVGFVLDAVVLGLVVTKGSDQLTDRNVWLIIVLFLSILFMMILAGIIAHQPRDVIQPYTVTLYVPHVPWTPLVALVMTAMMVGGLGLLAGLLTLVWTALGIMIYLLYGMNHSNESQVQEHYPSEQRGLIQGSAASFPVTARPRSKIVPRSRASELATVESHVTDSRDDVALIDCS